MRAQNRSDNNAYFVARVSKLHNIDMFSLQEDEKRTFHEQKIFIRLQKKNPSISAHLVVTHFD